MPDRGNDVLVTLAWGALGLALISAGWHSQHPVTPRPTHPLSLPTQL